MKRPRTEDFLSLADGQYLALWDGNTVYIDIQIQLDVIQLSGNNWDRNTIPTAQFIAFDLLIKRNVRENPHVQTTCLEHNPNPHKIFVEVKNGIGHMNVINNLPIYYERYNAGKKEGYRGQIQTFFLRRSIVYEGQYYCPRTFNLLNEGIPRIQDGIFLHGDPMYSNGLFYISYNLKKLLKDKKANVLQLSLEPKEGVDYN
jgi:hypothetical protein